MRWPWQKTPEPKKKTTHAELDYALRRAMLIEAKNGNPKIVDDLRALKDLNDVFRYMERGEPVPPDLRARVEARRQKRVT